MRTTLLLLVFLCASGMALAGDISGQWKGQITTPNGDKNDVAYTFKQDGEKLTGTTVGPQGDSMEILNGKITGDAISFTIEIKMNGGMKIPHNGKVSGDTIDLEIHFGDNPPMLVKLTKATS